jgi:hypothetical protein
MGDKVMRNNHLEIDGEAAAHAFFNSQGGDVGVSVEELKIADAVTCEEGAGYGAVKSKVGILQLLFYRVDVMYLLPHFACHLDVKMRLI